MYDSMEHLKDMLCDELEKFAQKNEISTGSLDAIHKLTDTIKNIDKIEMLDEVSDYSEYSERKSYARRGNSYDGGNSYARQRRDSMGRYAREGGSYRDGRSNRGGYSRAEAKMDIMDKIGELMEDANEQEKQILKRAMKSMENA